MKQKTGAAVIQWALSGEEYRDADAFAAAVRKRISQAAGKHGDIGLIVFPELSGFWLHLGRIFPPSRGKFRNILALLFTSPVSIIHLLSRKGVRLLEKYSWEKHIEQWLSPYQEAARQQGVYICPGSTFLPFTTAEDRSFVPGGTQMYHASCMIDPSGDVLGWRRKIHLTPPEKRLGLRSGNIEQDTWPFASNLGNISLAMCLDGFYEDVLSILDERDTQIVVQPSANPIDWNSYLSSPGGKVKQYEQWLTQGIGHMIQGRKAIRYALNPMDVTAHPFLKNSGCSTIWQNCGSKKRQSPYPGLMAIASDPSRETIVYIRTMSTID